jgi:hypothetical protein
LVSVPTWGDGDIALSKGAKSKECTILKQKPLAASPQFSFANVAYQRANNFFANLAPSLFDCRKAMEQLTKLVFPEFEA